MWSNPIWSYHFNSSFILILCSRVVLTLPGLIAWGYFYYRTAISKGVGVLNIQGYRGILEFIISYIVLNSSNARNH
nr:MAG TPA: hypothetical protein [Caudoviricetes sp.]